jgi:hypothetical protein
MFDVDGLVVEWNVGSMLPQFFEDTDLRELMKAAGIQHPDGLALDRGTPLGGAIQRSAGRTPRPEAQLGNLFAAVTHIGAESGCRGPAGTRQRSRSLCLWPLQHAGEYPRLPGAAAALLPADARPAFGVADQAVEAGK